MCRSAWWCWRHNSDRPILTDRLVVIGVGGGSTSHQAVAAHATTSPESNINPQNNQASEK